MAATTGPGASSTPRNRSPDRVRRSWSAVAAKKTLRLVAQYADACNVFGSPEGIARKYAILDQHCADVDATRARSSGRPCRASASDLPATPGPSRRSRSSTDLGAGDAGAEHIVFDLGRTYRAGLRGPRPGRAAGPARPRLDVSLDEPDDVAPGWRRLDTPGGIRDEGVA